MPGMPDPAQVPQMVNQMVDQVKRFLTSMGIPIPANVTPAQLAGGLVGCIRLVLYILTRFLSMYVLMAVGMVAYFGTQHDNGKAMFSRANARVRSVLGRSLPPHTLLIALCILVAVGGHVL